MAHDVTYFMQWTAEPELLERKKLGVYVLIYLFLFAILTILLKKRIWKRLKK
jgi:cytochrome c1